MLQSRSSVHLLQSKVFWLTIFTLFALGLHTYLAAHYYPLKFGLAQGPSQCNISAVLNCDAVAASPYADLAGAPIALFGVTTHLVLLLFLAVGFLGWSDRSDRYQRAAFYLASISLLASIAMASISLAFMDTYCLFCILLYVLSLIIFELSRRSAEPPLFGSLAPDLRSYFQEHRLILVSFLLVPTGAFVIHKMVVQSYGAKDLDVVVRNSIYDWQQAPQVQFVTPPLLTKGPDREKASMVISEFADFRCHHCKTAAHTLHSFVSSHPDVRFEFYAFPLDGACNEAIGTPVGLSCRLAYSTSCAEQQARGWLMHDRLFQQQSALVRLGTIQEMDQALKSISQELDLDWEALLACMDAEDTVSAIKNQAQQGVLARVEGTPTIYVNGRKLTRGQLIPVLKRLRSQLMSSR